MVGEEAEDTIPPKQQSEVLPRRKPKPKHVIPRRQPSVIVPQREVIFVTADKTTCEECTCFPKEDPYVKPKKLIPCLQTPKTLYELAAAVVDSIPLPIAFSWSVEDVVSWMEETVGLPQYAECISDNNINGLRLIMLEDPSLLVQINIRDFDHIKKITKCIREEYSTELVKFTRSIGLPPRKPLTHCVWFKSRTGPTWGIRQNWTRSDILRWMKILNPAPVQIDHWDLVWYRTPDFPKTMFARVKVVRSKESIPHYKSVEEECREYLTPRKFRFQQGISESKQFIWMEHSSTYSKGSEKEEKSKVKKAKLTVPIETNLVPKRINLTGLKGRDLILARRKMTIPKFLPKTSLKSSPL